MSALVKSDSKSVEVSRRQEDGQYLTFYLSGEMFAINILSIKEILEYPHLTPVPMMPEFIRGVINLRGAVVPVIDLSSRFGRPKSELARRACIVIIELQTEDSKQDIGVIVDGVSAVLEIPFEAIEPAPSFGANIRPDFISGMGKISEKFVIILNVESVLSLSEMSLLAASSMSAMDAD